MNSDQVCPQCRAAIPADSPAGVCPRCTLGLAMEEDKGALPSTAMGGPFVPPSPEELQQRFESLEIMELIGFGGMGAVYKARQRRLDRIVALKILSPAISADPAFAERFTREAQTLARLTHPNIVTVFEVGTDAELHYLLMEYVDGLNLRNAMRSGTLQPDQALSVVQQICDALQYAHDQGVVHRDIKPENILVGRQGNIKIADFGLAKLIQSGTQHQSLTGTQQVVGTRNYMAPEQIEKPNRVDHRADIYSLGVVFYELLTGELPLGRFPAPSQKAHIHAGMDDVVLKALEKEPDMRYQQASHVRTAVESARDSKGKEEMERAAAQTSRRPSESASRIRVPFSIQELYGGFAVALGVAHFDGSNIELEYEVRDDVLGAVKSKAQHVSVPIHEILYVRLGVGFFKDKLTFQADRMEAVKHVPGSAHAQFVLQTKKEDRDAVRQFVDAVESAVHEKPIAPKPEGPWQNLKGQVVEAVKTAGARAQEATEASVARRGSFDPHSINLPAKGLIAAGIFNAIVALGLGISLMLGAASWVGSFANALPQNESPPDDAASTAIEVSDQETSVDSSPGKPGVFSRIVQSLAARFEDFSFGTLTTAVLMAVVLILAGVRMLQTRDYEFCVVGAILAVIPFHPAVFLGLPFGIWSMVVLFNPDAKRRFEQLKTQPQPSLQAGAIPSKPAAQRSAVIVVGGSAAIGGLFRAMFGLSVVFVCVMMAMGISWSVIRGIRGSYGTSAPSKIEKPDTLAPDNPVPSINGAQSSDRENDADDDQKK